MSPNKSCARRILFMIAVVAATPTGVFAQGAGIGAAGELVDPDVLRVCADPSNMPFTDQSGEGFENKLAELVAAKTQRKSVSYTWYPMATGFVRNTLRANRCDVIMGYAQGDELVQNTNAYYRSTYVMIFKKGSGLDGLESLEDPKLADKRIGIVARTPPSANLARAKLMRNAKTYPLMVDTRSTPSMAEVMLKDLEKDIIDVAVLWGPMAGYYVKEINPDLVMVPLLKEKTGRMSYRITMGVRPSDQEWKRTLNKVIRENQSEINQILMQYQVPLIDEAGNQIKG
ncbi:quinoprotein dehydrogenase-associated ABC transporter substrate-binding protein (plasmid) [Rhizobium etli 8C-3]|uniref:Amino acid ABC transporter substrate-binding protein (PAAT family) n=2 Tax=Rhizobium TaxID=379 RepID=A0A4R3RZ68_9HYPH|nr:MULTISPECIES: substrate-binding domain-containing protein [Rhizobium]APO78402.1 quinoprotein dehydrogenase-associated ABC transporter substrate-binding protein [Rhizobium etli 8C-3]TCU24806.1 amino acid ABC transporter substrate-binding protein (PAAT family) [Rhizobium azibense]TCU39552.1 amino acid ABC transporter substrate-binding protein (PAAT family) [Rhizobium azibense]